MTITRLSDQADTRSGRLVSVSQIFNVPAGPVSPGNWDGVRIYYDHNHSDPVRAKVEWSTDNSNWTDVGNTDSIASGNIGYITATWTAPGRKRYWRLTFTDPNDGNIGSQSDEIREVDWRENGSYITDSAVKTSHNATITNTGGTIEGTLTNTYDGNTATGTTGINQGSVLVFDFGA